MSPGDVKWGIAFIVLLGLIFLSGVVISWLKFKKSGKKKELIGVFLCGLFTIGMIPAEMTLRSYTSASIVLDANAVTVLLRPMYKDRSIEYKNIVTHKMTSLTQLGGVGKRNGYSDGTERIGWFRMHRNHRKVNLCSTGDEVLFIEDKQGNIFMLAPPNLNNFLEDFQMRMNHVGE